MSKAAICLPTILVSDLFPVEFDHGTGANNMSATHKRYKTDRRSTWEALRRGVQDLRSEVLHLITFSGAINIMILAVPVFMIQIFDRVFVSQSLETLTVLAIGAMLALSLMLVLDIVRGRILARAGMRFESILAIDLFQKNKHGRLGDVAILRSFLTGPGMPTLLDVPWIPVFLIVVFILHPLLGWIVLGGTICLLTLSVFVEYISRRDALENRRNTGHAMAFASGISRNGKAATAALDPSRTLDIWAGHQGLAASFGLSLIDKINAANATARFLRLALQVALMSAAAALVIAGDITPGAMIAASVTAARALSPVERSLDVWRALTDVRAALARLSNLDIQEPGKVFDTPGTNTAVLQVERISKAKGPSGSNLLNDVSFQATAGQMLGVTGPSGSGKSSLLRVIAGIDNATSGRVILSGRDIRDLALDHCTRAIAYVPQSPLLFPGSIADNISGFANASPKEICRAAERAGADQAIRRLRLGYQTILEEGETPIEDGLKQQIMLARAFLRQPELLVMDEPYTFLDNRGVSRLLNTLDEMRRGGTIIVIVSQRPSILAHCDRILVMDQGSAHMANKSKQMKLRVLSSERQGGSTLSASTQRQLQREITV